MTNLNSYPLSLTRSERERKAIHHPLFLEIHSPDNDILEYGTSI